MRGSIKANIIIFLIIAVFAFCMGLTFANMTAPDDNDLYKLMSLENSTFEPSYIDYVPTVIQENTTNTTNTTDSGDATDYNNTDYNWNNSYSGIAEI
ncbi:MAG: hypothetical protein II453_20460 [Alphaproteobacteria bacterium]|nr:hypothetical protein [Alphaproteobacteria bacterium]